MENLKEIANENAEGISAGAVPVLVEVLRRDRSDLELVRGALEILSYLLGAGNGTNLSTDKRMANSNAFIKNTDNVGMLLGLLEDQDFYVRYNTIQLLSLLLENKISKLQECLLGNPHGISKLVETINDEREIIRNEGLLLLNNLTKTNADVQKLVAFEGAFLQLLDIIEAENYVDGGVIVQDCLQLMVNLLHGNTSNKHLFREMSGIQRLPAIFGLPSHNNITAQGVGFYKLALSVVNDLVTGPENDKGIATNQNLMVVYKVLSGILDLALSPKIDSFLDLRREAFKTAGRILKGNSQSKAFVVMAPETPGRDGPEPYLLTIFRNALFKQGFHDSAALCLHLFLVGNMEAKGYLAQALSGNQSAPEPFHSAALLLIDATVGQGFNVTASSRWHGSLLVASVLRSYNVGKDLIARAPAMLMTPVVRNLTKMNTDEDFAEDPHVLAGYLRLLCVWMDECPVAVKAFKANPGSLELLLEVAKDPDVAEKGKAEIIQGLAAYALGLALEFSSDDDAAVPRKVILDTIASKLGFSDFAQRLDGLVNAASGDGLGLVDSDFATFLQTSYGKVSARVMLAATADHEPVSARPAAAPAQVSAAPAPSTPASAPVTATAATPAPSLGPAAATAVPTSFPPPHAAPATAAAAQPPGNDAALMEAQKIISQQKMTILAQDEELERLRSQLKTHMGTTDPSLKAELDALRRANQDAESRAHKSADALAAANQRVQSLTQELNHSKESCATAEAELKGLVEAHRQLSAELDKVRSSSSGAAAAAAAARDNNGVAGGRDFSKELEALTSELAEERQKFKELNEEHEDLLVYLAEVTEENETLKGAQS
jgi:hypothetical protein